METLSAVFGQMKGFPPLRSIQPGRFPAYAKSQLVLGDAARTQQTESSVSTTLATALSSSSVA